MKSLMEMSPAWSSEQTRDTNDRGTARTLASMLGMTGDDDASGPSPVLPPETLKALALQLLSYTAADTMSVDIKHVAMGTARVARNRVRLNNSGDSLSIELYTRFGMRSSARLDINQLDPQTLRQAVVYLDRMAREQIGDPSPTDMPIPPRTYLPNTSWKDITASAFSGARHTIIPALVDPLINEGLTVAAFAGVYVRSRAYADKQDMVAAGQETDSELTVSGWNADGKGSGWAGQAARDWSTVVPEAIAQRTLRLTKLSANPVAFEPGRYTAILDRPAMAQIVRGMGWHFDAQMTLDGQTALYDRATRKTKIGRKIMDDRITLTCHPNDPEGGYLPFNGDAFPLIPMTWIEHGVAKTLAWNTYFAAEQGVTPANDDPISLRLLGSGTMSTVDEMIANCKVGIYVNRFAYIDGAGSDPTSGLLTGVTSGGCFLVRNGKIEKAIRNLRFVDSPWFFLNRLLAIGTSERTAFGYSPWYGGWPVAPTIVPPVMVLDFNFNATSDNV